MNKRTYHIAHVLPWSSVAGTEHATLRIAQSVGRAHFNSVFFYLEDAPAVGEFFDSAGFEVVSYRPIEPSYRRPKSFLRAALGLGREFRRRNISLVHCADLSAGYHTALAGRLARVPVLCHVRNRNVELSRRDCSFLRPVTKFVFVSRDTWEHFACQVPERRGIVIYDGIDVIKGKGEEADQEVRREFAIGGAIKVIGMVARVSPQKDYTTLARAAARVVSVRQDVLFLIVGDYSSVEVHRNHYEKVRQALAENKVESYFLFTGFREDVSRLIGTMDLFVLSTHYEGLPLVLLEAMAQGKPVVATDVDGIPELVIDGQTGLLNTHEDDAQLAEHLLALLQNEERARAIGEAGRQFVQTAFTREQFAGNMANLYRSMLGLRPGANDGM